MATRKAVPKKRAPKRPKDTPIIIEEMPTSTLKDQPRPFRPDLILVAMATVLWTRSSRAPGG